VRRRHEYPHAHEVPTSTDAGLEEAFRELEVRAVYEAGEHRRAMSAWSRTYFFVGLPAAVLAAIAGATALASTAGRIPAGIIALCASGLGAAAAFLDSETRRRTHEQLAQLRGRLSLTMSSGTSLSIS
jgi:hypothetical protein